MARPLRMEAEAAVFTSSRGSEIVRLVRLDRRRLAPAGAAFPSGLAVGGGPGGRPRDTRPGLRRLETCRSPRPSLGIPSDASGRARGGLWCQIWYYIWAK